MSRKSKNSRRSKRGQTEALSEAEQLDYLLQAINEQIKQAGAEA